MPDRNIRGTVSLVLAFLSCGVAAAQTAPAGGAASDPLRAIRERFAEPPARFRILKIIHNVPANPPEQDAILESLRAQGFGGLVTNVPFRDYLQGEAGWEAFLRTVRQARQGGMAMWLYDEHGYPSGNAGGLTLKDHPEWQARGLLIADAEIKGGAVTLNMPPGRLVLAAAFPVAGGAIDLDKPVDLAARVGEGKLKWDAPAGEWRVLAVTEDALYDGTHAALSLADKLPYVNLLQPEPTARFLELTHQVYAARLGDELGRSFIGTFTDEPSLMSLFLRPMPYRVLPWAPNLPQEFQARRGRSLAPLIPALVADAGPQGARARYEFWLTVAELVSENYFRQIRDWCRQHRIPSGGHLLMEEGLLTHVPNYGDLFRCERFLDAPSIDCLTSLPPNVPWSVARLVSSAAELEGRADTMCETSDHAQRYRPPGDSRPPHTVSEEEIRGTCNRLILNGMTCITSYYSFAGLTDEQVRRLNLWIGRCCAMLYGGRQVADVAVLYPVESVWPKFIPSRHMVGDVPESARRIERAFLGAAGQLFAHRRDFTFIDARTLAEATVDDRALSYRDLRWRVVVLPGVDTLPLKAWENLAAFRRGGGTVIALGNPPANSETEFPSARVKAIGQEMFGQGEGARCKVADGGAGVFLPAGGEARLAKLLDAMITPDVQAPDGSPLRATHRRIDGQEVFFVINDGPEPWEGEINLSAEGAGEQYDPATGAVTTLAAPAGIRVRLAPYGGVLFRFDRPRLPTRLDASAEGIQALIH